MGNSNSNRNYNSNKISLRVENVFARVLKGYELVKFLKKNMDEVSKYEKTKPDYIKYPERYDALFKIIIEYNVDNIEYNSLKILPKRNFYKLFNNKLVEIRNIRN